MSPSVVGIGVLVVLLIVRYYWVIGVPWFKDDFLLIELASKQSFLEIWSSQDAIGNAYRPLSRSLYFWLGLRLGGYRVQLYHVANLILAMTGVVFLFLLTAKMVSVSLVSRASERQTQRMLNGPAFATALLYISHPAFGMPLTWISGVQDLSMVTLCLTAMYCHCVGLHILYVALLAAGVLAKEPAVLVPLVLLFCDVKLRSIPVGHALRRQMVPLVLVGLWALFNPWLPWRRPLASTAQSVSSDGIPSALHGTVSFAAKCMLSIEPIQGFSWIYNWYSTILIIATIALSLIIVWKSWWPVVRWKSLMAMGLIWSTLGLVPLILVKSQFVYYAYYPMVGLCLAVVAGMLALGNTLTSRIARVTVIGLLMVYLTFAIGNVHHPSHHDVHAIRRAARYLSNMEGDLKRMHPTLAPRTRCFFWNIPEHIGFLVGEGSALGTWYKDHSIEGRFIGQYYTDYSRTNLFFLHDQDGHFLEVVRGRNELVSSGTHYKYADAYSDLGSCLARAGELEAAKMEYEKAIAIKGTHPQANAGLGIAMVQTGEYGAAVPILEKALRLDPNNQGARINLQIALMHRNEQ